MRAEGAGAKETTQSPPAADIQHAEAVFRGMALEKIHQQPARVPRLMALLLRRIASL